MHRICIGFVKDLYRIGLGILGSGRAGSQDAEPGPGPGRAGIAGGGGTCPPKPTFFVKFLPFPLKSTHWVKFHSFR